MLFRRARGGLLARYLLSIVTALTGAAVFFAAFFTVAFLAAFFAGFLGVGIGRFSSAGTCRPQTWDVTAGGPDDAFPATSADGLPMTRSDESGIGPANPGSSE